MAYGSLIKVDLEKLRPYLDNDEETIVKTYYNLDSLPEIQQERENARVAFVHGVNTAMPYGIVRIGDAFVGFGETDPSITLDFLGFSAEVSEKFWKLALSMYLNTDDENVIKSVEDKAMIIGYTRMMRRAIRKNEGEAKVKRCYEQLVKLVNKVDTLDF